MDASLRIAGGLLALSLLVASPSPAHAEGARHPHPAPSTARFVSGAGFLVRAGHGVVALGGSRLRYLAPLAHGWRTVYRRRGDHIYRVAADSAGRRVLALWEKDPQMHLFDLRTNRHVAIPRPPKDTRSFRQRLWLRTIVLTADGTGALVVRSGPRGTPTRIYRVALDGRSQPRRILDVPRGVLLTTTPYGPVFAMPRGLSRCPQPHCAGGPSIVAYEIHGDRVTPRTVFDGRAMPWAAARAIPGGEDGEVVVLLTRPGRGDGLLRFRFGGGKMTYRALPPPRDGFLATAHWHYAPRTSEVVYLAKHGTDLAVRRAAFGSSGAPRTTRVPRWDRRDVEVYGFGVSTNGEAWIHWGDDLVFVDADGRPRRYPLSRIARRGTEWAGASLLMPRPDRLWIGIENGPGRDYAQVRLARAARSARPLPAPVQRCGRLPPTPVLMHWRVHAWRTCSGGRPNPRRPRRKPLDVVKLLPDGTKIIDAGPQGCIRIQVEPCHMK